MNWTELNEAITDARRTMERADSIADNMALLLVGRLRKVDKYILAKLKRELRNFNPQRKEWKP